MTVHLGIGIINKQLDSKLLLYIFISILYMLRVGARGGAVLKALRYKSAGRGLEYFSDIILPVALWPWGRLSL